MENQDTFIIGNISRGLQVIFVILLFCNTVINWSSYFTKNNEYVLCFLRMKDTWDKNKATLNKTDLGLKLT